MAFLDASVINIMVKATHEYRKVDCCFVFMFVILRHQLSGQGGLGSRIKFRAHLTECC